MFENKIILVTGGTGSVGQCIVLHLLKYNIKKIIIYSRDEYKQVIMKNDKIFDDERIQYIIGDIKNYEILEMSTIGIDYIIHTAALKHVDICEDNPLEAIDININGSKNIVKCALKNNIEKVLFISTDKANNPPNTYGATKLLGDKICLNTNRYGKTKFSVIRFGNIFGSRGSVVELLLKNKKNIFKITDMNISRVFILWKNLIDHIFKSLEIMQGGEIFIPIAKSMYIKDIMSVIDDNKNIEEIGLRYGEKFEEILLSQDYINDTIKYEDMYIVVSKWCKKFYENYQKIDNIKYTSIYNDFYTKEEIRQIINNYS